MADAARLKLAETDYAALHPTRALRRSKGSSGRPRTPITLAWEPNRLISGWQGKASLSLADIQHKLVFKTHHPPDL
jgi:hypothetical protein